MHIGFRTSMGRGEYELVGSLSAYAASSLDGWTFGVKWPDGVVRDTGLWMDGSKSGKPRLRSLLNPQVQIGKIAAATLMLPDDTRARGALSSGDPVLRHKMYRIDKFAFGPGTEFAPVTDAVTIEPTVVEVANNDRVEAIGVPARWDRLQAVRSSTSALPSVLAGQVNAYDTFIQSGSGYDTRLLPTIRAIQTSLEQHFGDGNLDTDPLPRLERLLGLSVAPFPQLPSPPSIAEELPEIKARSAYEYRLAKSRGASGRRFAYAVQNAYAYRCMFCGGAFGGLPGIRSGVEAAHILAWSSYNLDVTMNGIALCKLHHWAFDAGLIVPVYSGSQIELRFTRLSSQLDPQSRALLGVDHFVVPNAWLPTDTAQWPGRPYLDKMYDDLAIDLLTD